MFVDAGVSRCAVRMSDTPICKAGLENRYAARIRPYVVGTVFQHVKVLFISPPGVSEGAEV